MAVLWVSQFVDKLGFQVGRIEPNRIRRNQERWKILMLQLEPYLHLMSSLS